MKSAEQILRIVIEREGRCCEVDHSFRIDGEFCPSNCLLYRITDSGVIWCSGRVYAPDSTINKIETNKKTLTLAKEFLEELKKLKWIESL